MPTEYSSALRGQTRTFAARVQYLTPEEVKRQLTEHIRDYNVYAFERDDEWDLDTLTSAKLAHTNALEILRTLFNDLPDFKDKASSTARLALDYSQKSNQLLGELAHACELKLKHTIKHNYAEFREADKLLTLRKRLDPLMVSSSASEGSALWPLVRHVW